MTRQELTGKVFILFGVITVVTPEESVVFRRIIVFILLLMVMAFSGIASIMETLISFNSVANMTI